MNIGIDCIALPAHFSGAANYIINLTQNLLSLERKFKIQIYCKRMHKLHFTKYLQNSDVIIEIPILNRAHQLLYYEKSLSKKLVKNKTDIFLSTHYITPPRNLNYKIVSIFHDLGFILHKDFYPFVKQKYFNMMIPRFIKRSEKIVSVSQSTLSDLHTAFPESRNKSIFIYPGTDHLKKVKHRARHNPVHNNPIMLAVNSFEKRKNIPFIIDVFNILKKDYKVKHQLILAGTANNASGDILKKQKNSPYREFISVLQDIEIAKLKHLYFSADLFINVSNYEGFGFTPMEAILEDCPAFLFSNNVCRELFPNHPYLINSKDPHIWAEKIYSEMRNNYSNKIGYDRISGLSWQKCAINFNNLFNSMLGIAHVQKRHPEYHRTYTELW